jgi:hypothetical protein
MKLNRKPLLPASGGGAQAKSGFVSKLITAYDKLYTVCTGPTSEPPRKKDQPPELEGLYI